MKGFEQAVAAFSMDRYTTVAHRPVYRYEPYITFSHCIDAMEEYLNLFATVVYFKNMSGLIILPLNWQLKGQ